jgi:TatD DNase family protein
MNPWIDAHTHLDADVLYPQRMDVLKRAEEAGLRKMLLVNSEASVESFVQTLEVAEIPNNIQKYVSLGIHPHHAALYSEELESELMKRWQVPSVIAIGEIGLDYYYEYSPRETQIEILRHQLRLSLEKRKPVVIHCREAYPELAEILKSEFGTWNGMIHCFTGNSKEAELFLELGFYISFSGIVTFRKATVLQEAAKFVPLNRMLIETDAPYLPPVPKRGQTNEPAFVIHTGDFIAGLKNLSVPEFATNVSANFDRLFGLT